MTSRESAALHFCKWLLATAAVVVAVLAIEVAAMFVVVWAVGTVSDTSALDLLSDVSSDPDLYLGVNLILQIAVIAVAVPWWRHVAARALGLGDIELAAPYSTSAERVIAVICMGLGMQVVITCAVEAILPQFPAAMDAYDELMETAGIDTLTVWSALSTGIAAPIMEEIVFRGIAMQFALRAVCPAWRKGLSRDEYDRIRVTDRQFWAANVLQAVAFGVIHMNVTQGLYAFAAGLVFGWVFWRTGKLRWSMALHAVFNLTSFGVDALFAQTGLAGAAFSFAACTLLLTFGTVLYERATRSPRNL